MRSWPSEGDFLYIEDLDRPMGDMKHTYLPRILQSGYKNGPKRGGKMRQPS